MIGSKLPTLPGRSAGMESSALRAAKSTAGGAAFRAIAKPILFVAIASIACSWKCFI